MCPKTCLLEIVVIVFANEDYMTFLQEQGPGFLYGVPQAIFQKSRFLYFYHLGVLHDHVILLYEKYTGFQNYKNYSAPQL